ncbi:hypothetical protein [Halobacillus andaensis]|uniref:hypothetical protein n=1 Tax=Halobacillus andaensis TaxID=1176239 RepID=UPI00166DEBAB|nr:hypothetical protein [Halobacillus andaensis]MBP2002884.1 hypothetical protein [Halobacillus andaensis]
MNNSHTKKLVENEATEKVLSNLKKLLKIVVEAHESLVGGCLPRARPQLTWSRNSLDQVDLRLALFPRRTGRASVDVGHRTWPVLIDQASPPNTHRSINRDQFKNPIRMLQGAMAIFTAK